MNRLIRISYGPFQLGGIPKEGIEEIRGKVLRDQVGHLVDIPEFVPRPHGQAGGQRRSKPKRGTHASAKRYAKDSKPAPKGRGKFAHKTRGKTKPSGRRK